MDTNPAAATLSAVFAALPRHNDCLFSPDTHRRCVANVAARFSVAEIDAAIVDAQRSIARNQGIEFDDTRARHKTGRAIDALREARAIAAEREQ